MEIFLRLESAEEAHRLWLGLSRLGRLGSREARKVADAGRWGIDRNFQLERSPSGSPWPGLHPRTVAERRRGIDARGVPFKTGGEHPILQRTGDLRRSFTDPSHPRHIAKVDVTADSTAIALGAEDDPQTPGRIALLHSGGTSSTGTQIPPRPFVGLDTRAVSRVARTVRWVLDERLKRIK